MAAAVCQFCSLTLQLNHRHILLQMRKNQTQGYYTLGHRRYAIREVKLLWKEADWGTV